MKAVNKIRKARKEDLEEIQQIARFTINQCYRSFLGDENVDYFISNGESDKVIEKGLANCDVLLKEDKIVAFSIHNNNFIELIFCSFLYCHLPNSICTCYFNMFSVSNIKFFKFFITSFKRS